MPKLLNYTKNVLIICLVLVGIVYLTACIGTLDVHVSFEPARPKSTLGKLAYVTGGDVWAIDLDSRQTSRLTRDGYNSTPKWSADGRHIAFLKRGALWVMETRSLQSWKVDDAVVEWFAWAPQGGLLASYSRTFGLIVWSVEDHLPTGVLSLTPGVAQENFTWRTDGEALLFNQGSTQEGATYQVSLAMIPLNQQDSISLYASNDLSTLPRMGLPSPDGRWLAYWLWDTVTPFADEDGLPVCILSMQKTSPACTEVQTYPTPESITWSSNGQLALVAQDPVRAGTSLVILDAQTAAIQLAVGFGDQYPLYPDWSPDGERIAISARPGEKPTGTRGSSLAERRIYILQVAGGQRTALTKDSGVSDERPLWSPDGSEILFARLGKEDASLWMVQSNGINLRQVVPELTPFPEPVDAYGYTNWEALWDWWRPANS